MGGLAQVMAGGGQEARLGLVGRFGRLLLAAQRLKLLALGDVAQHHQHHLLAAGVRQHGRRKVDQNLRAVTPDHGHVKRLGLPGGLQPLAQQVEHVAAFPQHVGAQCLPDHLSAVHAEQVGGAQVGLQDQARLTDRAITHWCQFIEIEVARALQFKLGAHPLELGVLHLQFSLVQLQFTQKLFCRRRLPGRLRWRWFLSILIWQSQGATFCWDETRRHTG